RANLRGAHLEEANLADVHLGGATLIGASLDKATRLNKAILTGVSLDQVILDNTNLAVVNWDLVPVLGDELEAEGEKKKKKKSKSRDEHAEDYAAATRAYRLLAVALQGKGLGEVAGRYSYRAQIMQRKRHLHQRDVGAYLGSGLLALVAGYGYRLWRVLAGYGAVLLGFTVLYWLAGVHSSLGEPRLRALWDSFLVSLSAIHGRTTFEQLGPWSFPAWVASVESVVGIVIEGVFVAVLIQRLFAR